MMKHEVDEKPGRLFFAVLPNDEAADRMHRLAHALSDVHEFDRNLIEPDRLHVSLFFLGEPCDQLVRLVCDAAGEVRAPAFSLWFDRSASFKGRPGERPFVLVGDEGVQQLKSFRRALGTALAARGLRRLAKRDFEPHVTLLYAERQVDEYPLEPIGWTVSEFVLVHSQGGHTYLGRWKLH